MKALSLNRILISLLFAALLVAGCELSTTAEPDASLDQALVDALTKNGERTLANFILPDSDDFETIRQDPRNPLTADKVELGKLLFHDSALATDPAHESGRGTYSCSTCHHAGAGFQAGRQQSIGDGGQGWGKNGEGRVRNPIYDITELNAPPLRAPTILNVAYQRVTMWAGFFGASGMNEGTEDRWTPGTDPGLNRLGYEGVETQAIGALVGHRLGYPEKSIVTTNPTYRALWERVFPGEPVNVENVGLAIAAYERTVFANRAPFQYWLKGEYDAMSDAEKRGALVFFGDTGCERMCHTGGPLNSVNFYALGYPDMQGPDVYGYIPETMGRGGFTGVEEDNFTFKIPQLYNLQDSPFLGHGGNFKSIREIVEYYNNGEPFRNLPEGRVKHTFKPLEMTDAQIDDLTLFLSTSLRDPDLMRYVPESVPSGACIPANDAQARKDLGCI